jgi:hypothetical protein
MTKLKIANDYGNVVIADGVPPRYRHIRGKMLGKSMEAAGIPYAAAVVDFKWHKRYGGKPVISGIVVRLSDYEKALGICTEVLAKREANAEKLLKAVQKRQKKKDEEEKAYQAQVAGMLLERFPNMPEADAEHCARIATGKGNVLSPEVLHGDYPPTNPCHAAVVAYVRHNHTMYDYLLMHGMDRDEARMEIDDKITKVIEQWKEKKCS